MGVEFLEQTECLPAERTAERDKKRDRLVVEGAFGTDIDDAMLIKLYGPDLSAGRCVSRA